MRKIMALLLGLLLTLGAYAPAAAAEPRGAQGVVTDELGRPVAGAEVEVYRLGRGMVTVLTTAATGAFRLEAKAEPGSLWQFRVSAKGYKTLDTGWIDLARNSYQALTLERLHGTLNVVAVDQEGNGPLARIMVTGPGGEILIDTLEGDGRLELPGVAPGSYRVLIRAGTLAPWSGTATVAAGSTATVTALLTSATVAVSGEVRDSRTGLPVTGARVQLLAGDWSPLAEERTDGSGLFRIALGTGVSGPVKVRVWAEGYRPLTGAAMTLVAGQEHDFSGAGALLLLPRAVEVAGYLMDENGKPKAGGHLTLEAKGYGHVASVTSDESGLFRFEQVGNDPTALYRVFTTDEHQVAATDWMALADGRTDQLVLQTTHKGAFGQANGTISGTVVASDAKPVAGATVELIRRNWVVRTVTTDQNGNFLADLLPVTSGWGNSPDPYTLRISKAGFVTTSQFVTGGREALELALPPAGRATLRATLRRETTELRGRLLGTRGEVVAGAELYLMSGPGTPAVAQPVKTDAQGWYSFKGVPAAPGAIYTLQGKAAGYQGFTGIEITPAAKEQQSVTTVKLTAREALFAGQVLAGEGLPVPGAVVELRGTDGNVLAKTDSDANGTYRLKSPVPATGGLLLVAGKEGYTRTSVELEQRPEPGTTAGRDLVILPATAAISGRVLNAEGELVPAAKVELMQEGRGVPVSVTHSYSDGTYEFRKIPLEGAGWFWLRVTTAKGTFAGSLRHGTDLVPLLQLPPGQEIVTDLLVR